MTTLPSRKHQCHGGVSLPQFRELIDRIRNGQDCDNPKDLIIDDPYVNVLNTIHDPELKALAHFTGTPRGIIRLLMILQKLITEKFDAIDKIYKHFNHVGHSTIDKRDFGRIMEKVGLQMCEEELNAVWNLLEEVEPTTNGLHNYHQVLRFYLESAPIRARLTTKKCSKRLHDRNLPKLKEFRQCQKEFKKQHTEETLVLGSAASEVKYKQKEGEKPSEERVTELCNKIRPFVISMWTDLRNGFLWQDPFGWGSMLCKDFTKLCRALDFPLDVKELLELARGLDAKNNG
ncbi:hypothetical protein Aperf_G00000014851 [Anoplocephala perfoliata]